MALFRWPKPLWKPWRCKPRFFDCNLMISGNAKKITNVDPPMSDQSHIKPYQSKCMEMTWMFYIVEASEVYHHQFTFTHLRSEASGSAAVRVKMEKPASPTKASVTQTPAQAFWMRFTVYIKIVYTSAGLMGVYKRKSSIIRGFIWWVWLNGAKTSIYTSWFTHQSTGHIHLKNLSGYISSNEVFNRHSFLGGAR